MPGYPCCCLVCDYCADGKCPQDFAVTITGVANGTCSTCTVLNTTFICRFQKGASPDYCEWLYLVDEPGCVKSGFYCVYSVLVRLSKSAGHYYLRVDLRSSSGAWSVLGFVQKDLGEEAPNCQFDKEDLGALTSYWFEFFCVAGTCDISGSNVLLSAV